MIDTPKPIARNSSQRQAYYGVGLLAELAKFLLRRVKHFVEDKLQLSITRPSKQPPRRIGRGCSIDLYGLGGLSIGDYVRIATHTVIVPANHIFEDRDTPITKQGLTQKGVVVEDDVWIGAGVKILDGCTVGKDSVLGARTVLTKSTEPYSVVAGVPGSVVRKRGK